MSAPLFALPRSRAAWKVSYRTILPLLVISEAILIAIAGIATSAAYQFVVIGQFVQGFVHFGIGAFTAIIYVLVAQSLGLFRIQEFLRDVRTYYQRVILAWVLAVILLTVPFFVLKIGAMVSRGTVVSLAVSGPFLLVLWRRVVRYYLAKAFENGAVSGRRAIIIGDVVELDSFTRRDLLVQFGIEEVERHLLLPWQTSAQITRVTERARQRSRACSAQEIILALAWSQHSKIQLVRRRLRRSPLPVRLLPDRRVATLLIANSAWPPPAYMVELQRAPLSDLEGLSKRLLDLSLSIAALLLLSPLLFAVAIAIKIDSQGPIVFKQRRRGYNGKQFVIYKFRTMRVAEDGPSIVQATRGDPRITRVGRLLRTTSIDELPQLINVIKGDMSLVGPRPHAVAHDLAYAKLIANYAWRRHVKPGITGLAQVNGCRGETAHTDQMAQRIELDLRYISTWSLILDVRILFRTLFEVFSRRNAY